MAKSLPPKPQERNRERAIGSLQQNVKEHWQKQGKQPTHREVERFVKQNAREADKKNNW